MRIGVVSQWYPPEPIFIAGELATELAARGHEVRVLTGFPNYPSGRIYEGFRQRWRDEHTEGRLTVRRVPLYPSRDASVLRRVATFVSFGLTSAIVARRYLRDVDVVYVYHPPPTAFAGPALLRLLRRTPVLLHVQDMWPESVTASGMAPGGVSGRVVHRVLSGVMRRLYRSAAAVVVIAPSMTDLVVQRGADPDRVRVVWNWTDERLFRPVPATPAARSALGHRGRPIVMYAGNMGPFQRVETAVRAAASVDPLIDLVFVGSGPDEGRARELCRTLGATNVRFLDRRPPAEMADLYAAADFQLVTLRALPALRGTVPSKLQGAMACGVPVIVSADGDAARLVEAAGAGLTCPAEDWRALADRFRAAVDIPPAERVRIGERARRAYLERMSLRVGVDQIEDVVTGICPGRPPAPRNGIKDHAMGLPTHNGMDR
ncbi:glycosyltransferase family 4 protein [Micromonospora sp. RP3T]|uniref:glycosyltransferase family 4 protein n=1 Tax=Micromonospora sp. RP3T TaxID=2135446 RepID=UPI000D15948C|nr:glycosyltransferase family 4 protein [Micromonospora sp. RP3T]PTA46287.1 glycosyltransferase WbuB [Micromonospora sp. RP3T]